MRRVTLVTIVVAAWAAFPLAADPSRFDESVKPFLRRHCAGCHNSKNPTAGLNVAAYGSEQDVWAHPEVFEKIQKRLLTGDMPPKPLPKPNADQQRSVVEWISTGLARLDAEQVPQPGRVTARRLNRVEYNNTIRDLFGIGLRPADEFPPDDSGYGFDNIGDVLSVSPVLMERYLKAAWQVSKAVVVVPGQKMAPTRGRVNLDGGGSERPREKSVTLDLPAPAQYRLVLRLKDNRRNRMEGARLVARFDQGSPATYMVWGVRNADNQNLEFEMLVDADQGKHQLSMEILDQGGFEQQPTDPKLESLSLAVREVEIRGPYKHRAIRPHEAHRRIFACTESERPDCAQSILSRLAMRAFRRPVTDEETARLVALARRARSEGASFEESIQVGIQAILVSPHFLFRIERDEAPEATRRLNGYELASRLSYFLWSSMPDDELFRLAATGELVQPEVLRAQTRRMLASKKAGSLVENFAGQWLQLRNLKDHRPDRDLFPAFDTLLRDAMLKETNLFFEAVMREDRPVTDLIVSRFSYLNERLAKHYGIEGVTGEHFRRVEVDGVRRGGLLSQGSILTISSYPTRTSPVIRGVWVLNNLLGTPPPPPPPDVPELEAGEIGKTASLREKLEKHRDNPNCMGCHSQFDPLGFGLENYDAIGRWRDQDGPAAVNASGVLPDGRQFTGPGELKAVLAGQPRPFVRTMASKMLTYALGRGLERYDRPALEAITKRMETSGYKFSTLVEGIVESLPFRERNPEYPKREERAHFERKEKVVR
jgi:mono/diheme cytochrome c family protein